MQALTKSLVALVLIALASPCAALAAAPEDPFEAGGFIGYFRGDELRSDTGSPILDDDIVFGGFGQIHFTENWGFMTRLSVVDGEVTNIRGGGDIGMTTTFIDFSATYSWHWDRYSVYVPAGLGYTFSSVDGNEGNDDIGFHVGLGLIWHLKDRLNFRFEGRYRIAGDLVETNPETVDVYETTLGLGWTF